MDTLCYLQLPDNFEELYREYKERLSSLDKAIEQNIQAEKAHSKEALERKNDSSEKAEAVQDDLAKKATPIALRGESPVFERNGDIKIGGERCHIAEMGDLQYHICKELLLVSGRYKLGDFISQTVLQDSYVPFGVVVEATGQGSTNDLFKSERWLRDALRLINAKTLADFGVELFEYKRSQTRLKVEIFK